MRTVLVLCCVAAAVAATAVPAAHAAGAKAVHHYLDEGLRHNEGLDAALKRGGCNFRVAWIPVVLAKNRLSLAQKESLPEGTALTLPDNCEKKPSVQVVNWAERRLHALALAEAAMASGDSFENLLKANSQLKKDAADAKILASDVTAKVGELTSALNAMRGEKSVARAAVWQGVGIGTGGGALLMLPVWFAWFLQLKKRAVVVQNESSVLFSGRSYLFPRNPDAEYVLCPHCRPRRVLIMPKNAFEHMTEHHSDLGVLKRGEVLPHVIAGSPFSGTVFEKPITWLMIQGERTEELLVNIRRSYRAKLASRR